MKFQNYIINTVFKKDIQKTALHIATEKGNVEIIKLLLNCSRVKVNAIYILNLLKFYIIQINQLFK